MLRMAFLIRVRGWFYYVFIKPSFYMIADDRYDRWDRCIVAGIVQIAGHIRSL